jgi:hypothetical protein
LSFRRSSRRRENITYCVRTTDRVQWNGFALNRRDDGNDESANESDKDEDDEDDDDDDDRRKQQGVGSAALSTMPGEQGQKAKEKFSYIVAQKGYVGNRRRVHIHLTMSTLLTLIRTKLP